MAGIRWPVADLIYLGLNQQEAERWIRSPFGESYVVKVYADGSRYAGQTDEGLWHGRGRLEHASGYVYEGEWSHGEKDGMGILTYSSGDTYVGQFAQGKRKGRGTHSVSLRHPVLGSVQTHVSQISQIPGDRVRFEGYFGTAHRDWKDGKAFMDRYQGEFDEDERHGVGVLTEEAVYGKVEYRAEYVMGKLVSKKDVSALFDKARPHNFSYALPNMYTEAEKTFPANEIRTLDGEPPFTFSVHPGLLPGMTMDPSNGAITGMGTEVGGLECVVTATNEFGSASTSLQLHVSQAIFESGHHAKTYDDGSVYRGEWLDGRWYGHGTLELQSGTVYTGEWFEGEKHGYGTQKVQNGAEYAGEWRKGLKHGFGRERYADGSSYEGNHVDGQRQGEGSLRRSDPFTVKDWRGAGNFLLGLPDAEVRSNQTDDVPSYFVGGSSLHHADRLLGCAPEYRSTTGEQGRIGDANVQALMMSVQTNKVEGLEGVVEQPVVANAAWAIDPAYRGPKPDLVWAKDEHCRKDHIVTLTSVRKFDRSSVGLLESAGGRGVISGIKERTSDLDTTWAKEGFFSGPRPEYGTPRGKPPNASGLRVQLEDGPPSQHKVTLWGLHAEDGQITPPAPRVSPEDAGRGGGTSAQSH